MRSAAGQPLSDCDSAWELELTSALERIVALTRQPEGWVALTAEHARVDADSLELEGAVAVKSDAGTLKAARARVTRNEMEAWGATFESEGWRVEASRLRIDAHGRVSLRDVSLVSPGGEVFRSARVRFDDGVLSATDVKLVPCPCSDGEHLAVEATQARWRASPDQRSGVRLEDAQATLGSVVSVPVPVSEIHPDGRASGFLLPALSVSEANGLEVREGIFLRLGEHADATIAAGWSTGIGPLLTGHFEHNRSPASRGTFDLVARHNRNEESLELAAMGAGSQTLVERLRGIAVIDLLSDPYQHEERFGALRQRSRRYGRSAAILAWDGALTTASLRTDLFQVRPRQSRLLPKEQRFRPELAPFPQALATVHRLPEVGLSHLAFPREWLRLDLDARYFRTERFGGGRFLDWGALPAAGELGALDFDLWDIQAGDGLQTSDEPFVDADQVQLFAALTAPVSLGGYGSFAGSVALRHDYTLAQRDDVDAFARSTSVFGSVELSTSLYRRWHNVLHVVEPTVAWRGVLASGEEDRLGAVAASSLGADPLLAQVLEGRVESSWLAPTWHLTAAVGAALFPEEIEACEAEQCGLGLAALRLRLFDRANLDFHIATPWEHVEDSSLRVQGSVSFAPWAIRVSHFTHSGRRGTTELASVVPSAPWAMRVQRHLLSGLGANVTDIGFARGGLGLNVGAAAAVLWQRDEAVELRGTVGYTGACGCWQIASSVERHVSSPRWDVFTMFKLFPGEMFRGDEAHRWAQLRPGVTQL